MDSISGFYPSVAVTALPPRSSISIPEIRGMSAQEILQLAERELRAMDFSLEASSTRVLEATRQSKEYTEQVTALTKVKAIFGERRELTSAEMTTCHPALGGMSPYDYLVAHGVTPPTRDAVVTALLEASHLAPPGALEYRGATPLGVQVDHRYLVAGAYSLQSLTSEIEARQSKSREVSSGLELEMTRLQSDMQSRTQMVQTVSNILRSLHEASSSVIQNMR